MLITTTFGLPSNPEEPPVSQIDVRSNAELYPANANVLPPPLSTRKPSHWTSSQNRRAPNPHGQRGHCEPSLNARGRRRNVHGSPAVVSSAARAAASYVRRPEDDHSHLQPSRSCVTRVTDFLGSVVLPKPVEADYCCARPFPS